MIHEHREILWQDDEPDRCACDLRLMAIAYAAAFCIGLAFWIAVAALVVRWVG